MAAQHELLTTDGPPAPAVRRGGWLTFSLRGLLFFSVLTVLIVSHVHTNYQWQRERIVNKAVQQSLQQEVDALRAELGYFRVEPEDKVHVLNLPQVESNHYRWRIYLPQGTKWKLNMEAAHTEDGGGRVTSSTSSQLEGGEFVLHVKLYRTENGNWSVGLMLPNRSSTASLQPNSAFGASSFSTSSSVAGRSLERLDPDKSVKLLDLTAESGNLRGKQDPAQKVKDEIRVVLAPEQPSAPPPSEKAEATVE